MERIRDVWTCRDHPEAALGRTLARLAYQRPGIFAGAEGLRITQLDAERSTKFLPQLTTLRSQVFGHPEDQAAAWLENCRSRPGFNAFVLLEDRDTIGAQISQVEAFVDLPKALRDYLGRRALEPHYRTIVWSNGLMVHPEYRRKGLATRLRLVFEDYTAQKYGLGGAFIISKIVRGNQGSEGSAYATKHRPTGIFSFAQPPGEPFQDFQY